ncbi:hypothetical protein WH47_08212 [Habropoda laboriosa]|uniref:Uncharacterized protein n=1 Tax=Habropoda laboriosa TaxID=597456 RepID=A0A0L7RGY3_9HYME|nr:hypothetical protein WH47_08212 [Habropoda laboriosa]
MPLFFLHTILRHATLRYDNLLNSNYSAMRSRGITDPFVHAKRNRVGGLNT